MAFTSTPIACSTASPYGPSTIATCATRPAILAAVAERAAIRAQQIADDSALKRALWEAEIATLRTPPRPKAESTVSVPWPTIIPTIISLDSNGTPLQQSVTKVSAPEPVVVKEVVKVEKPVKLAPEPVKVESKPEPKIEAITTPPEITPNTEDKKKTETIIQSPAEPIAAVSTKPPTTQRPSRSSQESKKSEVENSQERELLELVKTRSGTSSKVLDVGSQAKEPATREESNGVAAVEKEIPSNVLDAVNEGKLKGLTVTKLRRMLTECGLKTSGRKSELIARLTSYVRK